MRPQVGQVINNKYRLLRLIGEGGMGSVFESRHEGLGTTVALKFLHPELGRRAGLVQRFLQEARVSAKIQSPHVVRVADVDQTSTGLAFIVMEFIEGRTLQALYEELYRAGQRLSYGDALEYAMQMLEGVDAAHRAGIVHRDLKPDNVMLTTGPRGEPLIKILDFGIAKLKVTGELEKGLTRPGVIMGTPEYMAPEQAFSADAVDARADVFSLGVMIFEMLAGRRPVGGDDPHQIASQYLSGQVARLTELAPWVPAELAATVHRAMGAKPQDRLGSIGELRSALEPFAREARAPSAATPTPNPTRTPAAVAAATPSLGASPVPKTLPPEAGDGGGGPTPLGGLVASPPAYGATSGGQAGPAITLDRGDAQAPRPGGTAIGAPPFAERPMTAQTGVGGPMIPGDGAHDATRPSRRTGSCPAGAEAARRSRVARDDPAARWRDRGARGRWGVRRAAIREGGGPPRRPADRSAAAARDRAERARHDGAADPTATSGVRAAAAADDRGEASGAPDDHDNHDPGSARAVHPPDDHHHDDADAADAAVVAADHHAAARHPGFPGDSGHLSAFAAEWRPDAARRRTDAARRRDEPGTGAPARRSHVDADVAALAAPPWNHRPAAASRPVGRGPARPLAAPSASTPRTLHSTGGCEVASAQ